MTERHFNCLMTYVTPAGSRRTAHCKVIADGPEQALAIASKQLYSDNRRVIAQIVNRKAIEQ